MFASGLSQMEIGKLSTEKKPRTTTSRSSPPFSLFDFCGSLARVLAEICRAGTVQKLTRDEAMRHMPLIEQSARAWIAEARKKDVLARTYDVKGTFDVSPMMESVARQGGRVIVTFSTPGAGLKTRDGKTSDFWELAAPDGKFIPATTETSGAKVIVTAPGVNQPTSVRLGWKSDSNCNLVNSDGLPALPFTATIE